MVFRNFFTFYILPDRTPTGGKSQNTGVLCLKRPLALREIPGPGRKWKKNNFPVLGVPKRKKKVTTLSGMVVRNILTFYVLANWTPTGVKTQNMGFSGYLDLGRPMALIEKSWARAANGKHTTFRC